MFTLLKYSLEVFIIASTMCFTSEAFSGLRNMSMSGVLLELTVEFSIWPSSEDSMQSLWSISWWIVSLCIAAVFMKAASSSPSSSVVGVGATAAAAAVFAVDVVVAVVVAAAAADVVDVMLTGTSKKCYFGIF